jgi:DNA-directed RNA polymerase I subunit RPA2
MASAAMAEQAHPHPRTLSVPRTTSEFWGRIAQPHVDSFNFLIDAGLDLAVANIDPVEIPLYDASPQPAAVRRRGSDSDDDSSSSDSGSSSDDGAAARNTLVISVESASIGFPTKSDDSADQRIFPAECRERHISYSGALNIVINYALNGGSNMSLSRKVGQIPIMVGSKRCHLWGMSPADKIAHHEDASCFGGYFITNGHERCIRMLQIPKRNFVHVLSRNAYLKRGTECVLRAACCVRVRLRARSLLRAVSLFRGTRSACSANKSKHQG